ncbi:MAG: carbohydrate ABC transporter permease, partial [Bdellovibrionota bacterium]
VVCARIWAWMFHDLNGVVNEWLLALHWIQAPLPWLGNDRLARVVVMAVDLWKSTPFVAVLLLAGLQSIPAQVKESARVDGLSRSSEFLHITLPLLRPAIAVAALFRTLDALRVFDLPFVLTSNSRGAAYLSTFARTQIVDFQEVGYGSAASVLIFVAIGAVAVLYLRMAQSSLGLTKEPNG